MLKLGWEDVWLLLLSTLRQKVPTWRNKTRNKYRPFVTRTENFNLGKRFWMVSLHCEALRSTEAWKDDLSGVSRKGLIC